MKRVLWISAFSLIAAAFAVAQSPVPLVNQPLRPSAVAPGHAAFTLTVTGANFVSGATVNWNGSPRATTFVSYDKLTASILSIDVASAGTALVTVMNPGNAAPSNVAYFPIHPKFSAGAFARHDTSLNGGVVTDDMPIVADFNGDGKLDVATIVGGSTIEVFLGNGDGTFQGALSSNSSLTGASLVAVGDFNNDGKPDLIAQDIYGDDFTYLGNGDGTLTEVSTMGGAWPGGFAVADLNRDGKLDFINEGAQEGASGSDTELGNGQGIFKSKWNSTTIANQTSGFCAVADFNHDGKLDIACPSGPFVGNGIAVAFGNGDGSFGTPTEYSAPAVTFTVMAGDVNGDGKLDLVTDGGWVLLGNGDGTFNTPSGPAFSPMYIPQLVDINADGRLDVVGSAFDFGALRANSTLVALGNGDGTFQSAIAQEISWGNGIVAWGDFNGDGKLDAVTFAQDLITQGPIMSVLLQENLGISQTIISFGPVPVGSSVSQTSVLTNIGNSTITLGTIGFTSPAPSFSISNGCGSTLAAGANCSLTLTFSPKKTGNLYGKIRVGYSGTIGSPQYIELAGLGGN